MLRHINIHAVLNGFVVQVGCQSLAYTSVPKLIADLNEYLTDPAKAEKRLLPEFINRKHVHPHDFNAPAGVMTIGHIATACDAAGLPPPPCDPQPVNTATGVSFQ